MQLNPVFIYNRPSTLSVTVPENEHAISCLCSEFIDEIARAAQVVQSDNDFLQSIKLTSAIEYFRVSRPAKPITRNQSPNVFIYCRRLPHSSFFRR